MAATDTDDPNVPANPSPRPSWEHARPQPAALPRRPVPEVSEAPPPSYEPPASTMPAASSMPASSYEMTSEPEVRYDLAGNPIPVAAPPAATQAPFGYPPGSSAAASVWPPPVGGTGQGYGGAQVYLNTSGQQGHLPAEIERLRWHWGAFFFPTYWTRRHGLRSVAFMIVGGLVVLRLLRTMFAGSNQAAFLALCGLYVIACLGVKVYFGLNGHKIGWRNRHFPGGLEQYFEVQKRWMWWGFGINALGTILLVALVIGTVVLGRNPFQTPNTYGSGSSYAPGNYGAGNYSSPSNPNNLNKPSSSGQ